MKQCVALGVVACLASGASADGWSGLVIGQPGFGASTAFSDAFHVADALRASGFDQVQMLRDVPRGTVMGAVSSLAGAERVAIYFSGPVNQGGLSLKDGAIGVAELVTALQQQGVREVAVLIEDCADPNAGASVMPLPSLPDGLPVYLAASVGPGGDCRTVDGRMTDRLKVRDARKETVQATLAEFWSVSTLQTPISLLAAAPEAPVASPFASVGPAEVSVVSPVAAAVQPVRALTSVRPASASLPSSTGGVVVTFEAPDAAQLVAFSPRDGLPEPSIIVGLVQPEQQFDQATEQGDVNSNEITYESLEARRSLRASNPELFETLVAQGAFDPPEALLVVALQTELQRMGCYTARIDGDWGPGSRRSVTRYFNELDGVEAVSQEPTFDLFRQIIRRDDIQCPAPVAAAPARSQPAATRTTTRTTQTTRRAPTTTTAPRRQQTAPSRQPSSGRTISGNRLGSGVFR